MTYQNKIAINNLRIEGFTHTEIANRLGLPRSTVCAHIRRHPDIPNASACENCGQLVQHTPGHRKKRFCSDACRWTWWNSHPDMVKRKAYYTLTCCQCGKEFDSYGNQNRKYCSRECYYASRRSVQPRQSDAVSCVAGVG